LLQKVNTMETADSETEKIPAIAYRVKQLFDEKGLNASSAAKGLGYSVPSKLYGILNGTAAPGYSTLTEMLDKWPDVSAEWLLMGRGEMLRAGAAADKVSARPMVLQQLVKGDRVVVVTVDEQGNENTVLVPIPAQAGYALAHNEAVYVEQLSNYKIPGFERGAFRAFEVSGDSMEPTINHRDVVVCTRVDELRLLEPGEVYVVVTSESVMLKRIRKQLRSHEKEVTLYSDNYHRSPFVLGTSDIIELWRVRGYISNYIPSAPEVTAERLWEVIDALGLDRGEVRRHLDENGSISAPSA
jgi:phage repressor protein C with HTH and peptisase S24 domain